MRNHIKEIVEALQPHDVLEQNHREDALTWIRSGVPIFRIQKPDVPSKHLVSCFILFDETHKKVLLVDHKKAQLWLPTGGHVELDEAPKVTVERECIEELGVPAEFWQQAPLFITVTKTVGLTAGHTDVSLWYVLKGSCTHSLVFDPEEFYGVKWFGFDEIPFEKSDPHMERFMKKLKHTFITRGSNYAKQ